MHEEAGDTLGKKYLQPHDISVSPDGHGKRSGPSGIISLPWPPDLFVDRRKLLHGEIADAGKLRKNAGFVDKLVVIVVFAVDKTDELKSIAVLIVEPLREEGFNLPNQLVPVAAPNATVLTMRRADGFSELFSNLLRPERLLGDLLAYMCLPFRRRHPVLRRFGLLLGAARLFLGGTNINHYGLVGLIGVPRLGTARDCRGWPGRPPLTSG